MNKCTQLLPLMQSLFEDPETTQKAARIAAGIVQGRSPRLSDIAKVNINVSMGHVSPLTRYMPFYAVYFNTDLREETYAVRVLYGTAIAHDLNTLSPIFMVPVTACSREEKETLAKLQLIEGREGEVWFRATAPYHSGKDKKETIFRTKYLVEFDAVVTGLTSTTAQGRLLGAIEISDMHGKPLGSVGTGFDRETQQKIWDRFHSPSQLVIPVLAQGYTEDGYAWHARLSENYS